MLSKFFKCKKDNPLFYRLRDNSVEAIENEKFCYLDNPEEIKKIIDDFISKNKRFSIVRVNSVSKEVYSKYTVILKSEHETLELDERVYRLYSHDIEKYLNSYQKNAIELFGMNENTKINVNNFTSYIEIENVFDKKTNEINIVINGLGFNRTNKYDMELLENIIDSFLEDKSEICKIVHVKDNGFYLQSKDEKILFDFYAYGLVSEKLMNHNKKVSNKKQGISYIKKEKRFKNE